MPLYEYNCKSCGDNFEIMVRFNETVLNPECPRCQSHATHKLISMVASHGVSLSSTSSQASASGCKTSGPFR